MQSEVKIDNSNKRKKKSQIKSLFIEKNDSLEEEHS